MPTKRKYHDYLTFFMACIYFLHHSHGPYSPVIYLFHSPIMHHWLTCRTKMESGNIPSWLASSFCVISMAKYLVFAPLASAMRFPVESACPLSPNAYRNRRETADLGKLWRYNHKHILSLQSVSHNLVQIRILPCRNEVLRYRVWKPHKPVLIEYCLRYVKSKRVWW